MDDAVQVSPAKQQFIEDVGLYYERYGLARIGGRILALLILADRPLTLDAMAGTLGVARSSVSTNARLAVDYGFAERVGLPGDRRDYYRFSPSAWEHAIGVNAQGALAFRRLAEKGLAAVTPGDEPAQARLAEMLEFCSFYVAEEEATLARWRERRRGREMAGG